ncbi:MAG: flagellar protein FlaG [Sphaerobacter sp.]|nr:flagellar protein FlaG [Sphaerobacter sp.]
MANSVSPVEAIGDSPTRSVASDSYPVRPAQMTHGARSGHRPGRGDALPRDVVELSADGQALSALPPTVYLRFLRDARTNQIVVQVVDSATDEVIRQVPPRDLRAVLRRLERP